MHRLPEAMRQGRDRGLSRPVSARPGGRGRIPRFYPTLLTDKPVPLEVFVHYSQNERLNRYRALVFSHGTALHIDSEQTSGSNILFFGSYPTSTSSGGMVMLNTYIG